MLVYTESSSSIRLSSSQNEVDPAANIEESDESNNEGSQFFKVVRTSSSNPSFFMGFFALIGSVAVAVMLSSYYRNKDSEE